MRDGQLESRIQKSIQPLIKFRNPFKFYHLDDGFPFFPRVFDDLFNGVKFILKRKFPVNGFPKGLKF